MAVLLLCSGFSAEDSLFGRKTFLGRIKVAAEPMGRVGGKIPQMKPSTVILEP